MRDRAVLLAIGLGIALTLIVPAVVPQFVIAQGCTDAAGRPVECPPAAEQGGHKKKPSPTRPRDYKTATPTPPPSSTPTIISGATLTPTKVPVVPIIPGGDGAGDSLSVWPFSFGSDTIRMLFDGDARNSFSVGAGLIGFLIAGVIGFMGLQFLRKRADRINYDVPDDTQLIFDKQRPEGVPPGLETEIGLPSRRAPPPRCAEKMARSCAPVCSPAWGSRDDTAGRSDGSRRGGAEREQLA